MKPDSFSLHHKHRGEIHSVTPDITLSTTFEIHPEGYEKRAWGYSRAANPNRKTLQEVLAKWEQADAALSFSSGSAAAMSLFQTLHVGDHVLLPRDVYHGIRTLFKKLAKLKGVQLGEVDMANVTEVEQALTEKTRLLWMETPSNPMFNITDVKKLVDLVKNHPYCRTVVDNTFMTPVLQNPIQWGADVVLHSTTKFIGGHSDILGGALCFATCDEWFEQVRFIQEKGGAVPSPFDCWLLHRSVKTLVLRVEHQQKNAQCVAEFLNEHPKIERVLYPGLADFPARETHFSQSSGAGSMISFLVKGSADQALRCVAGSKLVERATSLGGVESTWEHRASSEGYVGSTPHNLIRMSVGIESVDDLLADVETALEAC